MVAVSRWCPFEHIFGSQHEADRAFNQLWDRACPFHASPRQLPRFFQMATRGASRSRCLASIPSTSPSTLPASQFVVRGNQNSGGYDGECGFEQGMTVPQFLDLNRVTASHRHGMLELTLPIRDSVKPRRIAIDNAEEHKQLTTA